MHAGPWLDAELEIVRPELIVCLGLLRRSHSWLRLQDHAIAWRSSAPRGGAADHCNAASIGNTARTNGPRS
jgi:uracil-DNA glycosylase